MVPQQSSPSGRIFIILPSCHTILEVSFSHSCVSWIVLDSASQLRTFSLASCFPGATVGRDTKCCTSFRLYTWQELVVHRKIGSSLLLPLSSRIDDTNSPLLRKYWAASQNELIVWNKSSVFVGISIEVYGVFSIFCIRISRLRALLLLSTGWPVSLSRCVILLAV